MLRALPGGRAREAEAAPADKLALLQVLERKVLWLSTWMIHNANHLRPKRDGQLTAVATPIHKGRTTHVWDIKISDENDKLVCISRCTVAVVDRPPDNGNPLERKLPSFG